jgi:hypothetical protein
MIPADAVEAAAKAACDTWYAADEYEQELWHRLALAALEAAQPHMTAGVQETRGGLDPDDVMRHYHQEFCEYDGAEDGEPVCAGECREFADALGGTHQRTEMEGNHR